MGQMEGQSAEKGSNALVVGAGTLGFVVMISLLSCMTRNRARVESPTIPCGYLRESARWSTIAAQETNPLLSLSHINYAIACAHIVSDMTSPEYLSGVMGGDFPVYLQSCVDTQNGIIRRLGQKYPSMAPDTKFALASGWL